MHRLPRDAPTILLMVVGAGLLCFTGWRVFSVQELLAHGARATGAMLPTGSHWRIGFTSASGAAIEFPPGFSIVSRPPGTQLPVVYDPADPAGTAMLDDLWNRWISPLWMLPGGVAFIALPLLGFRGRFGGRYG